MIKGELDDVIRSKVAFGCSSLNWIVGIWEVKTSTVTCIRASNRITV